MSRHHVRLNARLWARARKKAIERAEYRSELTGLSGRLEVHHRVRLEDGGAPYDLGNLVVITRNEHIALHEEENTTPAEREWKKMVREIVAE